MLNIGKGPKIEYQEREIKRLKDELGTVTGIKKVVTDVTDAVTSVADAYNAEPVAAPTATAAAENG